LAAGGNPPHRVGDHRLPHHALSALPIERITDALDPRLADYRVPRDVDHRARGIFVVESRLAVRQLLQSPRFATRSVLTTAATLEGLRDVLEDQAAAGPVLVTSPEIIREVVGFKFHRGCLAVGERGVPLAPGELIEPTGVRTVLVLEGLVDPENVGAVFRNALAFGADAVLLAPGCGDPLGRKAIRASAGGTLRIPFASLHDWPRELVQLRMAGYELMALTPDGATDLAELGRSHSLARRVSLLLGCEGYGLSESVRKEATLTVRIAMAAGVDSLNVATACGIALYHFGGGPARTTDQT
jgi:tRNA G18 (ribose-2'-O)-methylase SpoU